MKQAASGWSRVSISKGIDLFADLQAEHNSRQHKLAVLVGLRVRW